MDLDSLVLLLQNRNIDMAQFVSADQLISLSARTLAVFQSEPVFLELKPPIAVCGDIHAQYDDLLRIFNKLGPPPNTCYLFLGDYVDRGHNNLETISLLFCFKLLYPKNIHLLRGNHETKAINHEYGFWREIRGRYPQQDEQLWEAFNQAFTQMPVSAIVGERILCMHGGLSPYLRDRDDLRNISRGWHDPPLNTLENDLLWSDPARDDAFARTTKHAGWRPNTERGCSYTFGADIVADIVARLDIDLVVRAHEVVLDGYEFGPDTQQLITVFSAPNYCGQYANSGAVMFVDQQLACSFIQFRPPHPTMRRNEENAADDD